MKRKIVLLAMLALTGVGLAACSNHSTSNSDNKKTEQTESKSDEDAKYEAKQKRILAKTKKSAEELADAINDNKSNIVLFYSNKEERWSTDKREGYDETYVSQPAISLDKFGKKYNLNRAQRDTLSLLCNPNGAAPINIYNTIKIQELYMTLTNAKVIKGKDGRDTIYSVKVKCTFHEKDSATGGIVRSVENTEEINSDLVYDK